MANKYEVVNSILKNEGEGTYNVAFTPLNIKSTEPTTQEEATEVIGALTDAI